MKSIRPKMRGFLAWGLAGLALACMAWGIFRGEPFEVFQKAATICLECIGVG